MKNATSTRLHLFALILLPFFFVPFHVFAQEAPPDQKVLPKHQQELDAYVGFLDQQKDISSDSLQVLLKKGYQQFAREGNPLGQAEMLSRMGSRYLSNSMLRAAADALTESLALFGTLDDQLRTADVQAELGTALGRMGDYEAAAGHLMAALKIYEAHDHKQGLSRTHIKLGTVNAYIKNLDLARTYFLKALEYALVADSLNVVTIYSNIGAVHLDLGEYEQSEHYFKKALEYDHIANSERSRALALVNLGKLSKLQGKYTLAKEYYDQAMVLAEKYQLYDEAMAIGISRIDTTSATTMNASLRELSVLRDKAKELDLNYMQTRLLGRMIDLAKRLGQYQSALDWMQELNSIQTQLYDERKATEIANLQAVYDLEKSKEELSSLHQQVRETARNQQMILIFSGILVLGLLLALYFYIRSRRANALLKIHERELSEANNVKDKLFSVIGHDLKNAINTQPIVLELLKDGTQDEAQRKQLLDGLETSMQDVLYMLDILLNWGKMQIKGVMVQQTLFDVNETIEQCIKLFSFSAGVKEIKIINQIPDHTYVYADQDQFRFVVRNLISNAVKYSLKGGEVSMGVLEKKKRVVVAGQPVDQLVFYVEDHGVGMDAGEQATIFDAFRASSRGTANEIGNSIALMLSHEFIKKSGGDIWVESEKGIGTVFYFSLPIKQDHPRAAAIN